MAKRFTPVADPEKARCEQDEESLRRHRHFDTPHALLPSDLNCKSRPAADTQPLGRPTGELELDSDKLWRKKVDTFEKKKTWGRETFEYSNPEQARVEGNAGPQWGRPGTVGWGVKGNFGGRGEDTGVQVMQRGEVDQTMVKNEKGLWVRRKKEEGEEEDGEGGPVPEGQWRCPKCRVLSERARSFCRRCDAPKPNAVAAKEAKAAGMLKVSNPREDPRLEAAKRKGRGTEDAAKTALKALQERRQHEFNAREEACLHDRPSRIGRGREVGLATISSSSSQQVRPSKRLGRHSFWQGVQRTDEDARRIVEKAIGHATIGSASRVDAHVDPRAKPTRAGSPSPMRASSSSGSPSRSRSRSPCGRHATMGARGAFQGEKTGDEDGSDEVVVDFF